MTEDLLVLAVEAMIELGDPVPVDVVFKLMNAGIDYSEIVKLIEEKL